MKHRLAALLLVPALLLGACNGSGSSSAPTERLSLVASLPYLDASAPMLTTGTPVVVEFWATWCPPCVTSVPHLAQVQERFAADGLVIVGVHAQRGADDEQGIRRFAEARKVNYALALDAKGHAGRAFGVSGIPHAFVYDRSGALLWNGHPMDPAFEAAVERAVGS